MAETDQYDGMIAETITIQGNGGDWIHAYYARPMGPGPYPAVVLAHHMPGWDEFYREVTRKFAHHGYLTLCPDLYCRSGHGSAEDMAAKVRAEGGVPDDQVVGDLKGALNYVRGQHQASGKVGVWGTCSGGRHALLAASRLKGFDAVADLWGGGAVMAQEDLTPARPVAPIDYTPDLSCPLLGLFGAEDRSPTPDQVAQHEAALKEHGKEYEFHMYEGAGHGFFYYNYPQAYRAEQAVDGWKKVFDFFGRKLA